MPSRRPGVSARKPPRSFIIAANLTCPPTISNTRSPAMTERSSFLTPCRSKLSAKKAMFPAFASRAPGPILTPWKSSPTPAGFRPSTWSSWPSARKNQTRRSAGCFRNLSLTCAARFAAMPGPARPISRTSLREATAPTAAAKLFTPLLKANAPLAACTRSSPARPSMAQSNLRASVHLKEQRAPATPNWLRVSTLRKMICHSFRPAGCFAHG